MYAKYFHGDMAFQTKVVFLGLPVYNSVDMIQTAIKKSPSLGEGHFAYLAPLTKLGSALPGLNPSFRATK